MEISTNEHGQSRAHTGKTHADAAGRSAKFVLPSVSGSLAFGMACDVPNIGTIVI
jgi:hypothetical protein